MERKPQQAIIELLEAAGTAHHHFEQEELKGQFDEDWPLWYAAHLLENGLANIITPPPNQIELSQLLAKITALHEQAKDVDWNEFAAQHIVDRYLPTEEGK